MQRDAAHTARGMNLSSGPTDAVVEPDALRCAVLIVACVGLKRMRPHRQQRCHGARRHPVNHPFRHGQAGAPGIQNTVGIHARGQKHALYLGCGPDIGAAVGGEAFGAVEKRLDAHVFKQRHPRKHPHQVFFDMVHVKGQLIKFEIIRDAVFCPSFALCLKPADEDLAGIFLPVIALFHDVEDWLSGWQPFNRFGHDIEMFCGVQRHGDAVRFAKQMRPHSASDHDLPGGDGAFVCDNPHDFCIANFQSLDLGSLKDLRAFLAGTLGQRDCHIQRVNLTVGRHKQPRLHIVDDQRGPMPAHLFGR